MVTSNVVGPLLDSLNQQTTTSPLCYWRYYKQYNTGQSVAQPYIIISAMRLRPHLSQWWCGSVKPSARLPVYLILRSPGKTIHKLYVLITDWFYAFYYLCYHRCCTSTEAWITCLSFGHYLTLIVVIHWTVHTELVSFI